MINIIGSVKLILVGFLILDVFGFANKLHAVFRT